MSPLDVPIALTLIGASVLVGTATAALRLMAWASNRRATGDALAEAEYEEYVRNRDALRAHADEAIALVNEQSVIDEAEAIVREAGRDSA